MEIDILGIDLAKRVLHLHGADGRGRVPHRSKVSRAALLSVVRELRPRAIAMEACSSAHHWGRCFQEMGLEVRLISPQYVSPFVKTNKNDRNDAEAIVEAACRPAMRFVPVKSVDQQDMQGRSPCTPVACPPAHRPHQPGQRSARRARRDDCAIARSL